MPDIVIDCPEYNRLTNGQKNLIQSIVKPEADGLHDFIGTYAGNMDKLTDLHNKHKANTYKNIRKLLQTANIDKDDIINLIRLLNENKIAEMKDDELFIDEDEAQADCEKTLGFDCTKFGWTIRCVKELEDESAETIQRIVRGIQSRLKSAAQGYLTLEQKKRAWPRIKRELIKEMIDDDDEEEKAKAMREIESFRVNHYLRSAALKKKKKNKKKKKKKKKTKKKKTKKKTIKKR